VAAARQHPGVAAIEAAELPDRPGAGRSTQQARRLSASRPTQSAPRHPSSSRWPRAWSPRRGSVWIALAARRTGMDQQRWPDPRQVRWSSRKFSRSRVTELFGVIDEVEVPSPAPPQEGDQAGAVSGRPGQVAMVSMRTSRRMPLRPSFAWRPPRPHAGGQIPGARQRTALAPPAQSSRHACLRRSHAGPAASSAAGDRGIWRCHGRQAPARRPLASGGRRPMGSNVFGFESAIEQQIKQPGKAWSEQAETFGIGDSAPAAGL